MLCLWRSIGASFGVAGPRPPALFLGASSGLGVAADQTLRGGFGGRQPPNQGAGASGMRRASRGAAATQGAKVRRSDPLVFFFSSPNFLVVTQLRWVCELGGKPVSVVRSATFAQSWLTTVLLRVSLLLKAPLAYESLPRALAVREGHSPQHTGP